MIRKFISRVMGKSQAGKAGPRIYTAAEHGIDRRGISQGALRVCEGLQREGYAAFVVGGAVRDLMLGRYPKDFDVATSATPEQVRGVFRRARIIGRRFRLVHVMFGAETVEVSTFRAHHSGSDVNEGDARSDEHGRLLRDNVFGGQEEDAIRRDFTANALFYDPERDEVWDYLNGVPDLKARKLAIIGDPEARYREDPVRMLRAARFAAKLGFAIEKKTEAPIAKLAHLLDNIPAARLFDEVLKLLMSGHAVECIEKLQSLGLHRGLLPMLDQIQDDAPAKRFVMLALQRTDERIAMDKGVSPAFLLAALMWPLVSRRVAALEKSELPAAIALHNSMDDVLESQRKSLAMPRRLDADIKEVWLAQSRFLQRGGSRPQRMLTHPRFRACYDFLLLRAEAGDAPAELAEWWTHYYDADEEERETLLRPDTEPVKKKRRRGRRKARTAAGPEENVPMDTEG